MRTAVETWLTDMHIDRGLMMSEFLLAGATLKGPIALVALFTLRLSTFRTLTVTNEVENHLHLLCEAQRFDFDGLTLAFGWTLVSFDGNLEENLEVKGKFRAIGLAKMLQCTIRMFRLYHDGFIVAVTFLLLWHLMSIFADTFRCVLQSQTDLVSNGNVGTLPAIFPCAFHAVLTDGPVADGNSLWQSTVFQNDLGRQRLWKTRNLTLSQAATLLLLSLNQCDSHCKHQ